MKHVFLDFYLKFIKFEISMPLIYLFEQTLDLLLVLLLHEQIATK